MRVRPAYDYRMVSFGTAYHIFTVSKERLIIYGVAKTVCVGVSLCLIERPMPSSLVQISVHAIVKRKQIVDFSSRD